MIFSLRKTLIFPTNPNKKQYRTSIRTRNRRTGKFEVSCSLVSCQLVLRTVSIIPAFTGKPVDFTKPISIGESRKKNIPRRKKSFTFRKSNGKSHTNSDKTIYEASITGLFSRSVAYKNVKIFGMKRMRKSIAQMMSWLFRSFLIFSRFTVNFDMFILRNPLRFLKP